MIFDHISNARLYSFPNLRLSRGLQFLATKDPASLSVGRTELEGDQLFVLVQEYSTRPMAECFWEAHRKYIDIQFIAAGVEEIGFAPLGSLNVSQPYDETKDMMKLSGDGIALTLKAGSFAVLFPHDAHRPCVAAEGRVAAVKKVVMKVGV